MDKYTDKKILIIGGGTSTLDVNWENLDYDFVWTCNDFYLEPRVYNQDIDLYVLSYMTDLNNPYLRTKLRNSNSKVIIEPLHYRQKAKSEQFREFKNHINIPIEKDNFFSIELHRLSEFQHPSKAAGAAGVCFRMILMALQTNASTIYFSGLDGFNEKFTNVHAFTKHPGLKDTDSRRTYKGTQDSYYEIFTKAYEYFLTKPGYRRLQNLGEGFDYNIGTSISKEHFPLKKEVYEKIMENMGKSSR